MVGVTRFWLHFDPAQLFAHVPVLCMLGLGKNPPACFLPFPALPPASLYVIYRGAPQLVPQDRAHFPCPRTRLFASDRTTGTLNVLLRRGEASTLGPLLPSLTAGTPLSSPLLNNRRPHVKSFSNIKTTTISRGSPDRPPPPVSTPASPQGRKDRTKHKNIPLPLTTQSQTPTTSTRHFNQLNSPHTKKN